MTTVKVIREIPGLEIGELLPVTEDGFVEKCMNLDVGYLIKKGWVEVFEEEKSLAEKMGMSDYEDENVYWILRSQIAKEHYSSIIKDIIKKNSRPCIKCADFAEKILEAIENG